jgi:hypothetical protein
MPKPLKEWRGSILATVIALALAASGYLTFPCGTDVDVACVTNIADDVVSFETALIEQR